MAPVTRTTLFAALVGCTTFAHADFDGPAAVAWRWAESTSAVPGGQIQTEGDFVYVATGGRIYCVRKDSGTQVWRFPVAEPYEAAFRNGAVLSGNLVVASNDARTVFAVDKTSGKLAWQYISADPIIGAPVATSKYIVFGTSTGQLMALNTGDGSAFWSKGMPINGLLPNLCAWQDKVAYLSNTGAFGMVDIATQKTSWENKFTRLSSSSAAVAYGDTIYVNAGSYVTAVRASSGGKKWDQRIDNGTLLFSPAVSANGVAVVSSDGNLYTYDTGGRPMYKKGVDLGSNPVASPAFAGKLVTIGTSNGSLSVIDPRSGELVFSYTVPPMYKGMTITTGGGGGGTGLAGAGGGTGSDTVEVKYVPLAVATVSNGDTLLAMARDGSVLALDKNLGVDLTAPTIKMIWPNSGDQISGQPPLELWFAVDDSSSGVKEESISVTIGGNPMSFEYFKEGYVIVRISAVSTNKPLMDGRQEVVVKVADWLGNQASESFSLTVDNTIPRPLGGPKKGDVAGGGPGGGLGGKGGGGGTGK